MSLSWRVAGSSYRQGAKSAKDAKEETEFLGVLGALAVEIPARTT